MCNFVYSSGHKYAKPLQPLLQGEGREIGKGKYYSCSFMCQ